MIDETTNLTSLADALKQLAKEPRVIAYDPKSNYEFRFDNHGLQHREKSPHINTYDGFWNNSSRITWQQFVNIEGFEMVTFYEPSKLEQALRLIKQHLIEEAL